MLKMFDLITVGHFCIDSILFHNRNLPYVVLGGPATYVSLGARRLQADVSVISKVGYDFPEAYKKYRLGPYNRGELLHKKRTYGHRLPEPRRNGYPSRDRRGEV